MRCKVIDSNGNLSECFAESKTRFREVSSSIDLMSETKSLSTRLAAAYSAASIHLETGVSGKYKEHNVKPPSTMLE